VKPKRIKSRCDRSAATPLKVITQLGVCLARIVVDPRPAPIDSLQCLRDHILRAFGNALKASGDEYIIDDSAQGKLVLTKQVIHAKCGNARKASEKP
jgi:hypothetical protein